MEIICTFLTKSFFSLFSALVIFSFASFVQLFLSNIDKESMIIFFRFASVLLLLVISFLSLFHAIFL